MKSIECSQCGHENDLTRVFCQNCGARLERPAGDPTISGPTKVPAETRFRSRAAITGFAAFVIGFIRRIVSTAILAALLAVAIQMGRQPDGVPPAQTPNEVQAGQLLHAVQVLSGSNYARALDISQAQANNYLAASIVPDPATTGNSIFRADFRRAFVMIKSGELEFFVEQRFYGWPIYMYLVTAPETSGGKSSLRVTGGGIGRMPLNTRLIPLLQGIMRPVISSTSEAATVLETADEIVFTPSMARLSWKAGKPAVQ